MSNDFQRVTISIEYVTNGEGKHSFLMRNDLTNNILFTCPKWFDTKELAKAAADKTSNLVMIEMVKKGSRIISKLEDNITMEVPETAIEVDADHPRVLGALVMNKHNKKFSVIFFNTNSEPVLPANGEFDTPEAAMKDFEEHREEILAELHKKGYRNLDLNSSQQNVKLLEEINDYLKKNNISSGKTKEVTPTSIFEKFKNFDPSIN